MNPTYTPKTNNVDVLTRLTLTTFLHIGQMTQYRYQYCLEKELQKDTPFQVNADEMNQNRTKMIYHTCLTGLGIIGLLAIGISRLNGRELSE